MMAEVTKKFNFSKANLTVEAQKNKVLNRVQSLHLVNAERRHKRLVSFL